MDCRGHSTAASALDDIPKCSFLKLHFAPLECVLLVPPRGLHGVSVQPVHPLCGGARIPEGTRCCRAMSVSVSMGCSAYLHCHNIFYAAEVPHQTSRAARKSIPDRTLFTPAAPPPPPHPRQSWRSMSGDAIWKFHRHVKKVITKIATMRANHFSAHGLSICIVFT